jgi:hypothetical protein
MVEDVFRSVKTVLETRPIYHLRTDLRGSAGEVLKAAVVATPPSIRSG